MLLLLGNCCMHQLLSFIFTFLEGGLDYPLDIYKVSVEHCEVSMSWPHMFYPLRVTNMFQIVK